MTDAQPARERRSSPRAPISEFVELDREDLVDPARALALNLSNSGVAVAHCLLGQVGEVVSCRMLFTPYAPLELGCRIVWVREASQGQPAAMGLCFEDVTETSAAQLDALVSRIRAQTEASQLASLPIDPFCEPGTWGEDVSDTFHEPSSPGNVRGDDPKWVAPASGPPARRAMSWRLAVLVGIGSLLGTLAIWFAVYLLLSK